MSEPQSYAWLGFCVALVIAAFAFGRIYERDRMHDQLHRVALLDPALADAVGAIKRALPRLAERLRAGR